MRSGEDGNGNQAWQALLRARTARNATNLLNILLEPIFTSPDPRIHLRQWNKNAEEYNFKTYTESAAVAETQTVPLGSTPKTPTFYDQQTLRVRNAKKNGEVGNLNLNAYANASVMGTAFYLFKYENLPAIAGVDG